MFKRLETDDIVPIVPDNASIEKIISNYSA